MTIADAAIPMPKSGRLGAKPKAKGSRQNGPETSAATLIPVVATSTVERAPLESQTLSDVKTWMTLYATRPGSRTTRPEQIYAMISGFRSFCEEYTARLAVLGNSAPHNWLESAVDNTLLDYWEPVLRAAEQNRSPHYRDLFEKGYKKLTALQATLEKRLKFRMDINIVLYLEKIGKAKRYPFGHTYLIGIPLIDAYQEDWMSVPHELGHHIFWNARFSDEDKTILPMRGTNFLQEEINSAVETLGLKTDDPARSAIQRILDDWTEEIFADVVGARIAGKEFVDASWGWVSRKVGEQKNLFLSDGQHPIPYLIPYIRAAAANVDPGDHWQELFGEIPFTQLVSDQSIEKQYQDPTIQIKDLKSAVQAFAVNITARLKKIKIDQLIQGPSSMKELEEFVNFTRGESSKAIVVDKKVQEKETLKSLMNPIILERAEGWTCRNNHPNSGDRDFCQTCGVAHHWWNYIVSSDNQ